MEGENSHSARAAIHVQPAAYHTASGFSLRRNKVYGTPVAPDCSRNMQYGIRIDYVADVTCESNDIFGGSASSLQVALAANVKLRDKTLTPRSASLGSPLIDIYASQGVTIKGDEMRSVIGEPHLYNQGRVRERSFDLHNRTIQANGTIDLTGAQNLNKKMVGIGSDDFRDYGSSPNRIFAG